MPDDVFTQIRAIHLLLAPSNPPVVQGQSRRAVLRLSWPRVLDGLLLLLTAGTYTLANFRAPERLLIGLAVLVLVGFIWRLVLYWLEYIKEANAADPEAHAGLMERSARELHVTQQLQAFDIKALEYVLAEYDGQLDMVDRFANTWLGPARVGGVIGFVALLLGVYPAIQKLAGAWAIPLLAFPFGLGLGGFLGVGSFDGRRRARALLARATALKKR